MIKEIVHTQKKTESCDCFNSFVGEWLEELEFDHDEETDEKGESKDLFLFPLYFWTNPLISFAEENGEIIQKKKNNYGEIDFTSHPLEWKNPLCICHLFNKSVSIDWIKEIIKCIRSWGEYEDETDLLYEYLSELSFGISMYEQG